LKEIYGKGGKITKWSQLGVDPKKLGNDKIVLVSRQNSSGTYAYFAETVLGKGGQYKLGTLDQSGSADVVALVAHTPGAIGYSGMGFATHDVRKIPIARHKGEPAVEATVENALKKTNGYPITRPLYIYTAGEPTGKVKAFLDWILGKEGQQVLEKQGYVSVLLHD
jgi:phosphate transport system substrate-binding protein